MKNQENWIELVTIPDWVLASPGRWRTWCWWTPQPHPSTFWFVRECQRSLGGTFQSRPCQTSSGRPQPEDIRLWQPRFTMLALNPGFNQLLWNKVKRFCKWTVVRCYRCQGVSWKTGWRTRKRSCYSLTAAEERSKETPGWDFVSDISEWRMTFFGNLPVYCSYSLPAVNFHCFVNRQVKRKVTVAGQGNRILI